MKPLIALVFAALFQATVPGNASAFFQSIVVNVKEGDKLQKDYFEVWEITCDIPAKDSGKCQIVAVALISNKEVTRVNTWVHTGRIHNWYGHNYKAEFDGRGGLSLILSLTDDDRKATRVIGSLKSGRSFEMDTDNETRKILPIRNESFAGH